jgi:hypothetical protein
VQILIARRRLRLSELANRQKLPTAFETDNGPSALAAGTALHALERHFPLAFGNGSGSGKAILALLVTGHE